MDVIFIILIMIVLLLLEGFFSGSEIALVHAERLKLQHLANQGHRGAALVISMLRKPEVLLGTTLVGTNISLVALTTLGTIVMIRLFGEHGDILAFLIYTPLFLIVGEIVPKSVFQQKADTLVLSLVYPLRFFSWLFYPVVFVFSWIARKVAHFAGVEIAHRELFSNREQIRTVLEMAEQGADIDVFDRDRIMRVTRFADATVGQVMIPMAEMTILSTDNTTRDAVELARERGHFRLPVFKNEHNEITGVLSLTMWDLMNPELRQRPLTDFIQPAYFVTAHQLLDELLPVLQQRKDHMAIVVDEFESAIGMITLEDVLEEVVGEVVNVGFTFEGFLPRHKYTIEELADGSYLMDGRVSLEQAGTVLDVSLPTTDAHTVGGMVIAHLRHIPVKNEYIIQAGYRFTVEEVTDRGIQKLRVEQSG